MVILKRNSYMIFDEPTSALDSQTTERFMGYLQGIKRNKIILIITHDEGVKGFCDGVVEMAGSVVKGDKVKPICKTTLSTS